MGRIYNVRGSRIINGPRIVTSALVLSLDAADRNSYISGSITWRDLSGNNYSGSLINGPTFDPANGGSIYTDGADDYVITNYSGSQFDSYTFSAWFKKDYNDPDNDEERYVFGRGRDGPGAGLTGWSLFLSVSTGGIVTVGTLTMNPLYTGEFVSSTTSLLLDKWYHITGVYTAGSTVKCYINGVLEGTGTNSGTGLRTSPGIYGGWWLGSVSEIAGQYTSGYTAIAQVYNRVLTVAVIIQNYNSLKSRFNL
jgi:hypothetical protein